LIIEMKYLNINDFIFSEKYNMSKIVYYKYSRVPALFGTPHYNDAQYYFSEKKFTLRPKEDVLVIVRNSGQHWLKPQSFRFIEFKNDAIFSTLDTSLYQPCLWIMNTSTDVTLEIPDNSSLTHLLNELVVTFEYSLINLRSLYK